jgi:hypothetical protein
MFQVLDKKKDTSATKANKEASASTTVFAHFSGISKSMVGTALVAGLFDECRLARLPLTFVNGKGFLPEFAFRIQKIGRHDGLSKVVHAGIQTRLNFSASAIPSQWHL